MAIMRKHKQEKDYVEIPNKTALAPETRTEEKSISLQALGLIVNIWSYDVTKWELHKTQLYERFEHNKETSVKSAWKELVEANYILEFKVRVNGKNDYEYIYNIVPFTDAQIEMYIAEILDTYGNYTGLDFQDLKNKTSKTRPQNQEIINTKETKDLKKEKLNKKNKLASLDDMNSVDLILKKIFPEVPFDEIKTKLIDDALKNDDIIIDTKNRYQGLLNSRIKDWKRSNKAYSRPKSHHKEMLPEWFDEESEPNTAAKTLTDEEAQAKRGQINEKLEKFRMTDEEKKAEIKEILKSLKNND